MLKDCLLLFFASSFLTSEAIAASLEGRVVNLVTNEPVPNVQLTLTCLKTRYSRTYCPQTSGKTSSDGSFRFENVYPATYLVTASGMPGLVSIRTSQMEAAIDPKHSISDLVLKLAPESGIAGKVLDEDGHPKADVEVAALRQVTTGAVRVLKATAKTVSDNAGGYVLHGLVPGNYYVASGWHNYCYLAGRR